RGGATSITSMSNLRVTSTHQTTKHKLEEEDVLIIEKTSSINFITTRGGATSITSMSNLRVTSTQQTTKHS
ncbi:hypothetical protein, partial [Alkalihalobacillus alcalophilus]|uniref:hypothetical protein n=1 Tax=Alkalihalobacillus alcalophilus TaxID=1445 RepID=UPI001F319F8C